MTIVVVHGIRLLFTVEDITKRAEPLEQLPTSVCNRACIDMVCSLSARCFQVLEVVGQRQDFVGRDLPCTQIIFTLPSTWSSLVRV